jgi:hypothetical protein
MAPDFCSFSNRHRWIDKKIKGNVVPVPAVKAYRGSRCIAPFILNLGTEWR